MTDTPETASVNQQAIAWVVRVSDPAFDDWDGFEHWLSASPAHADAYHAAAAAEADIVAAIAAAPRPVAAPAIAPIRRAPRALPWAGAALAASLIGVLLYRAPTPAPLVYATAPGVQRTITLADGSSVMLNGGTRLIADQADPRTLELLNGEAMFTVRHDETKPFRVTVGSDTVVDVGTRFDLIREGAATRIMVAEGAVDWQRRGEAVRVDAGKRLRASDGSPNVELGAVEPDAVGGWSRGQMTYDGTALADVAADLARTLGTTITVAPTIAKRPVRSVVRMDGGAATVVPRLAALIGVRARWDGRMWRLTG